MTPQHFLPLKISKGGPLRNSKCPIDKCVTFLTEDQAKFICNKVNARREINTKTINKRINRNKSLQNCNTR